MKKASWFAGLSPADRLKQAAFDDVRVKHRKLDGLLCELATTLMGGNDSNIIFVTGATGVGKSAMIERLLHQFAAEMEPELVADKSAIPLICVEAYANGETRHSFRPLFEDMREQLLEPGIPKKTSFEVVNGRIIVNPSGRETIPALRRQVEYALKHRKTKICVIDEAYHMMRFGEDAAVMATLKSIANKTSAFLVLVGSFDLLDFVDFGQIARRSSVLNLDRYHKEVEEDCKEFKLVVERFLHKWPCAQKPNLVAVSDDLLEESFGCVGQLKSLMLKMSAMQFRNGGKWDNSFLRRAAKSFKLREVIRSEIETGERKILDALVGQGVWDDSKLEEMVRRMEAVE